MDSKTLIYAGETVPCFLRDGDKPISVKLRLIKLSEIPAYLDIATDEEKALAFCIESHGVQTPEAAREFFDSLTDESYELLVEKNTALNFTRALATSGRRLKRAEACGLGLAQLVTDLASLLNRYSPKSPSPEASPAPSS